MSRSHDRVWFSPVGRDVRRQGVGLHVVVRPAKGVGPPFFSLFDQLFELEADIGLSVVSNWGNEVMRDKLVSLFCRPLFLWSPGICVALQ